MSPVIIWFGLGALLMLAELFTPGFVMVFFGVGAWGAALTAALWPGLEQELAVFLALSLLSLFLLRNRLVMTFQGDSRQARRHPDFPLAGHQAQVTRAIPARGEGEIALGGSFWRATADVPLAVGAKARALAPVEDDELLIRVEPMPPA